ncbi:DUF3883 domain-containing protein [Alkalimonas amylolytica]|uniref:Protein NO VEIN C-terminal domain-containing protein n=1 Tax=Alkalimonas amylolytica TaxID=152573 RepID=A0A1H3YHA0_ALKAM|nr:DUF3883 domain-containing protein [Alkalimonas amylolytica]SEA10374.1 protein of unknown function [Alkalimonas amylolytica]
MDDSIIPITSEQWFKVLRAEEQKTKKSYLAKPSNLISNYRGELATSRDYEGREILELLQNAADQAKAEKVSGKVVIELTEVGLLIANNGKAFSIGGVKSLQNAHLSPKRLNQQQFIGCKGLGFRSILNWTKNPIILSGELAIYYSDEVSANKLQDLMDESSELADLVQRERGNNKNNIILPKLPFPGFPIPPSMSGSGSQITSFLFDRCLYWKSQGYTTVIGIPFENAESFSKAMQQIESLRPEMLLFVPYLDEVQFALPEKSPSVWSKEGDDDASLVMQDGEPIGIWQLFRTQGSVDKSYLDDSKTDLLYEIVIAVPEVEHKNEFKTSPLFTYFPTEINLPLPVVCHATFELDQSRNQISKLKSNEYVFTQLASFLAEVAEKRAAKYPLGANAGFRVAMPLGEFPESLKRINFPKLLNEACKARTIVPTIAGNVSKVADVFSLKGANPDWLPVSGFKNIVPNDDAEFKWFRELGISELSHEALCEALDSLAEIDLEQRVKLILGLKKLPGNSKSYPSSLLLSSAGERISGNADVYIAPKGGVPNLLPGWTKLWFLDVELQHELMVALHLNDVRSFRNELKQFGLQEYAFGSLIQDLRRQANHRKELEPEQAAKIEQQLLDAIYRLYLTEGDEENKPAFPQKTSLKLLSQNGQLVEADILYMGEGYGVEGRIVQQLYEPKKDRFVASPETFGIQPEDLMQWCRFMNWLGVAKWPREVKRTNADNRFLQFLADMLKYPLQFDDYIFTSKQDLYSANLKLNECVSLDGLDNILVADKYQAVIAWLSKDPRSSLWQNDKTSNASLTCYRSGAHKLRQYGGAVPSYIHWLIKNTNWMIGSDNKAISPNQAILADALSDSIFPRPAIPQDAVMAEFGIDRTAVISAWRHAGVITNVAELSLDGIYAKLLELPNLKQQLPAAKTLYRWLLGALDAAYGDGGSNKAQFFETGKIWGKKQGQYEYFNIRELSYIDDGGLPEELLNRLAIAEISHRSGSPKVERLLGIKSIDRNEIQQTILSFVPAATDIDIDLYFQQAKPFFKALRENQSSQIQYRKEIDKLKLNLCSKLELKIKYQDVEFSFEPKEWEWSIDADVLYIKTPNEVIHYQSDLLADVIGVALASIYRLANGSDFARLFRCSAKERLQLLGKMLGENISAEQLAALATKESVDLIHGGILDTVPVIKAPTVLDGGLTLKPPLVPEPLNPVGLEAGGTSSFKPEDEPEKDGNLDIIPMPTKPMPVSNRRKLSIKKVSRSGSGGSHSYSTVDGDLCERKVLEIEESFEPPRFPLLVGQYTGDQAFGCDILSFATEEAREQFRLNENRDWNLVERFIEVKGRKDKQAEIELRGNEKKAALKYGDKYYLYRICKTSTDTFNLTILRNPLLEPEVVEHSVYIALNRSSKKEEFEIVTRAGDVS